MAGIYSDCSTSEINNKGIPQQKVKCDLVPLNTGAATTYHHAQNRCAWSVLIGTAAPAIGQDTQ